MDSASPSVTSVVSAGRDREAASKVVSQVGANSPQIQSAQVQAESKPNKLREDTKSEQFENRSSTAKSEDDAEKSDSSQAELTKKEIADSLKDAEKKAKQLEHAFARINAPFKVSFEGSGKEINFQVIEAESGKVIRKFPPPAAQSILDRLDLGEAGALLDESA